MKFRKFMICSLCLFLAEILALMIYALQNPAISQDAVEVNEAVQSVRNHWEQKKNPSLTEQNFLTSNDSNRSLFREYENRTSLDYVVLDLDGSVLYRTKPDLSESINAAVIHRDTILDIVVHDSVVGKILIYNSHSQSLQTQKRITIFFLSAALCVQCCISIWYLFYLNRRIIKPFQKLKGFAKRIAAGNLDIPLEMDKANLFGAFTESFDIMRSELKKARIAEAEANASKKELVAKLSHDIKTPVASIKAASEFGVALTERISIEGASEKDTATQLLNQIHGNYTLIIRKADQINALITNLFTATLEELRQLSVTPTDMASHELKQLFENADYLHRASIPGIPDCLLYADKLRLQQVFDNLFANSYKYGGTKIDLQVSKKDHFLSVSIEDDGGGVKAEELPLLKEKFKRGSNAGQVEGAGLGFYISDYFMKQMHGNLILENGRNGLKTTVMIAFSEPF